MQKRDNKGRILFRGERQRSDGRYEYRYKDNSGQIRSVYSWRLVATDPTPSGKTSGPPLRNLEKRIRRDLEDSVSSYDAYKTTLNALFDKYMSMKTELKDSTLVNYMYMYNRFIRGGLGLKNVTDIKYSDIKKFYLYLINDVKMKPSSMETINNILHPVFTVAVRDGLIRTNPTEGAMAEIKHSHSWDRGKRHPLSVREQTAFIEYCLSSDKYSHWTPLFIFLLGTGCRIGEALGLRWEDCDFEKSVISINHSVIYRYGYVEQKTVTKISTPKTRSGTRIIPMLSDVKRALLEERLYQVTHGGLNKTIVDGYSGFIFKNRYGKIMTPASVNRAIQRIVDDYNQEESVMAEKERREAQLLPHFSAHHLRHTFCTRFCENETNLKVIQEIMGHASIETTMNIYNEATIEKKIESFSRLDGKIKIV